MGVRNEAARNEAHAPKLQLPLQQARHTKTGNRIYHRRRLPPENPTGHREAQRRISQMHELHKSPQS
jgi:hypothetical protein